MVGCNLNFGVNGAISANALYVTFFILIRWLVVICGFIRGHFFTKKQRDPYGSFRCSSVCGLICHHILSKGFDQLEIKGFFLQLKKKSFQVVQKKRKTEIFYRIVKFDQQAFTTQAKRMTFKFFFLNILPAHVNFQTKQFNNNFVVLMNFSKK